MYEYLSVAVITHSHNKTTPCCQPEPASQRAPQSYTNRLFLSLYRYCIHCSLTSWCARTRYTQKNLIHTHITSSRAYNAGTHCRRNTTLYIIQL